MGAPDVVSTQEPGILIVYLGTDGALKDPSPRDCNLVLDVGMPTKYLQSRGGTEGQIIRQKDIRQNTSWHVQCTRAYGRVRARVHTLYMLPALPRTRMRARRGGREGSYGLDVG